MRYVILRHETPPSFGRPPHYDLMLERDGALQTWAVERLDEVLAGETVTAEKLADHRLAYLEYEGPVSNDRGSVSRWDAGEYEKIREEAQDIAVRLSGGRFQGELMLCQDASGKWTATLIDP